MQRPRPVLLLALAATAAVSAYALLGDDSTDVQPITSAVSPAHAAVARDAARGTGTSSGISYRLAPRPAASHEPRDLFAAYSWAAPPPPPPPAAPPAPPQAPPLPFVYGGSIEIEGKPLFLLIEGVQTHQIAVGDQVGDFRLQSVGSRSLVFQHVPTGLEQTLDVAGLPITAKWP
jgi:hypothetical protein